MRLADGIRSDRASISKAGRLLQMKVVNTSNAINKEVAVLKEMGASYRE